MAQGDYTLADLLGEPQLKLELLTGGREALSVPLVGAHAIELEHPAKWLDSGWMMLTMGVRLRNKPHLQRQLIAELQELGASCLGFGVGLSFKSVPPALLDEAKARNFPVVAVPEDTQFRDITRAVFHSTVGIESATFQRLSSIQQNLIRAFAEDNPLESILQRLGRLVHSTVAVMSLDGQVDAATGTVPVAEIIAGLSEYSQFMFAQFDVTERRIMAAPVTASRGPSARWLVVVSRQTTGSHELPRAAIQVTAPLIDALMRLNVTNTGQDRAVRQAVLDSVLDDDPETTDMRSLSARVSALGVEVGPDVRTVVVKGRCHDAVRHQSTSLEDVTAWLYGHLESLGARYLLSHRGSEIVFVANASAVSQPLARELVGVWPELVVGLGRPAATVADVRTSHRDAQIAVQHLAVQHDKKVMTFDDLDVVTQLLAEVPAERFAATAAPIAQMLAENPIQLEALRAFFANNRDVKAAADSIYLHPNTLRYRLERLEHALGRSLREPAVTASLYCVLTLMDDLVPSVVVSSEQGGGVGSSGEGQP
ncbi:hypothetical protein B5P44_03550, partial [Mycobacterium sp. CBMA 213]